MSLPLLRWSGWKKPLFSLILELGSRLPTEKDNKKLQKVKFWLLRVRCRKKRKPERKMVFSNNSIRKLVDAYRTPGAGWRKLGLVPISFYFLIFWHEVVFLSAIQSYYFQSQGTPDHLVVPWKTHRLMTSAWSAGEGEVAHSAACGLRPPCSGSCSTSRLDDRARNPPGA